MLCIGILVGKHSIPRFCLNNTVTKREITAIETYRFRNDDSWKRRKERIIVHISYEYFSCNNVTINMHTSFFIYFPLFSNQVKLFAKPYNIFDPVN